MRAFGGTTAGVREDLKKEKHCTVYMTDRQREERKRERERERERERASNVNPPVRDRAKGNWSHLHLGIPSFVKKREFPLFRRSRGKM
jgi:hypothetical protein